jgi:superfamily II DNA or RNA helicase
MASLASETEIATYLGKKGYSIKKEYMTVKEQNLIKKELMMKPYVPKNSLAKPNSFPVYRESNKKLYIPKFYGIKHYGYPEISKIGSGKAIDIEFKGELRDYQLPIVDAYIKAAHEKGGGLLELHTGAGKTVCGLRIISKIKRKTLIIVHKEFLLRQWVERIEQFLPTAKVGRIQGNIIDVEDKDIVIGMLQSLSMKNYDIKTFSDFGLTIVDEVHHISSEVFSRSLFKIVTKYTLGLSATLTRKDGLTKVIKMFLGDVVFRKKRKGENKVLVKAIEYISGDAEFDNEVLNWRGQVNYTSMIKKLCEYNRRSEFILQVLEDTIKKGSVDDQIMILGHNKSVLHYLYDAIKHRNIATVGYYVGGMKEKDLKISEGKKIIIGTYAMAEEGLDIKSLTTLLMATPKVSVNQAIGRILRKKDHEALVIDIIDTHSIFQRHWTKRLSFYKKQMFRVIKNDSINYEDDGWDVIVERKGETPFTKSSRVKKTNKTKKKIKPVLKIKTGSEILNRTCLIDDDD